MLSNCTRVVIFIVFIMNYLQNIGAYTLCLKCDSGMLVSLCALTAHFSCEIYVPNMCNFTIFSTFWKGNLQY